MTWHDVQIESDTGRAQLAPVELEGGERIFWFEWLWREVCSLRHRYRLPVRSGWWADPIHAEALAAFALWVERYDSGEWDDPPGKLALLFELERLAGLLRDGMDPFIPDEDRGRFERFLADLAREER